MWYSMVLTIIVIAIGISVIRFIIPEVDTYKEDIESWLSVNQGQRIEISALAAEWSYIKPQLVLEDVRLLSADGVHTITQFKRIKLDIKLLESLRKGYVVPGALTIEGARLVLTRQADGHLSLAGIESGGLSQSHQENRFWSDWLFGQSVLEIKESEFVWIDKKLDAKPWQFSAVNLQIRNDQQRHQIDGSIELPNELGHQLKFSMDLTGNILASDYWAGDVFIEASGISIKQLLNQKGYESHPVSEGRAFVKAWSHWEAAKLTSIRGEILASDLLLHGKNPNRLMHFEQGAGNFLLNKSQEEWQLIIDNFVVKQTPKFSPEIILGLQITSRENLVKLNVSYMDVQDLIHMAGLLVPELPAVNLLHDMRLRGELHNVNVAKRLSSNEFLVHADFNNVSTSASGKVPGVKNIKGNLLLSENDGSISLDSKAWELNYSHVFANPIQLASLTGEIFWQKQLDHWEVQANNIDIFTDDAAFYSRLNLLIPHDDSSPLLDFSMNFSAADLIQSARFYPAKLMKPATVHWIDRSIKGGYIKHGQIKINGKLKDFPFKQKPGTFLVKVAVANGVLDYVPGWPRVTNIIGELSLSGNQLDFIVDQGVIANNRIKKAHIYIDEFDPENLLININGQVFGSSLDKLNFLHNSPLEEVFAKHLRPFHVVGVSALDMQLVIPLANPASSFFKGNIDFINNHLTADSYKLDLNHVNGRLMFDKQGIKAKNIKADLAGTPLVLEIETLDHGDGRSFLFHADAKVNHKQIDSLLTNFVGQPNIADHLLGNTHLKANLLVPVESSEPARPIKLTLASELKGLRVDLPKPANKTIGEEKTLLVDAELSGMTRFIRMKYGSIDSILQFSAVNQTQWLERGSMAFGVSAKIPSENGFHYVGQLDSFSYTAWQKLLDHPVNPLIQSAGANAGSQFFDLQIKELEFLGHMFHDVHLQASQSAQGWSIHTSGPELTGKIFAPTVWKSAPLIMELDRLHVTTDSSQGRKKQFDPRELPEVRITSKSFFVDQIDLGQLTLIATGSKHGMRLDKLTMHSPSVQINAVGDWVQTKGEQQSIFDIDMTSANFGHTLSQWGYTGTLEGGSTDIKMGATWQGSPMDFSLENLTGKVVLSINKGNLMDINPGTAGRIFGLLSLQSLPRIFEKGFNFDGISGEYDIKMGNAYTSGLLINSPIAKVDIAGRINLIGQNYDQVVTVVPKIGEGIPLLGAFFTAVQPVVAGVAIFVVQKFFEPQFEDLSAVQYEVTGPWEKPKIKRVERFFDQSDDFLDESDF